MRKKILVTGGAGYIGSHTLVDLIDNGYDVLSIDNLSRGFQRSIEGVKKITGYDVINYNIDLCNIDKTREVFNEHPDIIGVIHFAAFKSVPESVKDPLKYYHNNINSLINVLQLVKDYKVKNFVFSSSCSVYGNTEHLPVTEESPLGHPESPYAHTKQIGEGICQNFIKTFPEHNIILLRYFNPAGSHTSAEIGDLMEIPENVVPIITQTAIGRRASMQIYGDNYPTRDGTCIRDYIHVMDIAHAHTLAIQYMLDNPDIQLDIFNLGTGEGVSVKELIDAFESVNNIKLNYSIGPRRPGDVVSIYANNEKAINKLKWRIQYTLADMMLSAWNWEKNI